MQQLNKFSDAVASSSSIKSSLLRERHFAFAGFTSFSDRAHRFEFAHRVLRNNNHTPDDKMEEKPGANQRFPFLKIRFDCKHYGLT